MHSEGTIEVKELVKRYGPVVAVDHVSFTVHEGEVVGLVGPNGAGKTTTLECLCGLRRADSGRLRVFGLDPQADRAGVAGVLGVQLQTALLPDRLRVSEAVSMYAGFYAHPLDGHLLLEEFGLADCVRRPYAALSGGQRQRLAIVLALIGNPRAVVLDELTTGLDPQGRHATWDVVASLQRRGLTILLSTHFMEEAERLCDRVAVIDGGRLVAMDSPAALASGGGGNPRIIIELVDETVPPGAAGLPGVAGVHAEGRRLVVQTDGTASVGRVLHAVERLGVRYVSLRVETPNLEEAYLALTGRQVRD